MSWPCSMPAVILTSLLLGAARTDNSPSMPAWLLKSAILIAVVVLAVAAVMFAGLIVKTDRSGRRGITLGDETIRPTAGSGCRRAA